MRLDRRKFLLGSGALAGVVAAGSGAAIVVREGSIAGFVERTVRDHLPPARLQGTDVRAFALDYLSRNSIPRRVRVLAAGNGFAHELARRVLGRPSRQYEHWRRDILTSFLLSTGYFQRAPDDPAPLVYAGLVPEVCQRANPFANFIET